jgi:hypothetical protein
VVRAFALFLAVVLAPSARAAPLTYTVLNDGISAVKEVVKTPPPTIGSGRYPYRFTLLDPHTGLPWPRQAYALSLTRKEHHKLPFVAEEKGVYQGITDELGRTSIILLPFRVADQHWDFRERFGEGPFGETFKLVSTHPEEPLVDMPYVISICSNPPQYFHGYSHADGKTAYTASFRPERLEIREGVDLADDTLDACSDPKQVAPAKKDAAILPPEFPAKVRLQAILYEGDTALKAHDYAKAHARFAQAEEMFRDYAAELQNSGVLMGHAEIAYYAALATGGGKLGDPCPELSRARRLAETAGEAAKISSETNVAGATNELLGDVDTQAKLYRCPGANGISAQQSLVGHYYLSGIHEVGSELLLKADARFDWMLAYGSMDQSASGTWRVDGKTLILDTDPADASAPLAFLGPFIAWDIDAENALRHRALEAAQTAVAERCPLLVTTENVVSTPRVYLDDAERAAAKVAAAKEIAPATERERASRARLEIAAAAAMSGAAGNLAALANAKTALATWLTDDAEVYDVYDRAGVQMPPRDTPKLPAVCIMPTFVEADSAIKTGWSPALGVQLRFADEELSAAPMNVTFHFRKAADRTVETDHDGYAFLTAGEAQALAQVSVAIRTANGMKDVTLPVSPPKATGIQIILLNAKSLVGPAFETMRLKIEGSELSPEGQLARGKYTRQ